MTPLSDKAAYEPEVDQAHNPLKARLTDAATAALRDLLLRADHAAKQLDVLAQVRSNQGDYAAHLASKAQGVRLVISYIEEALSDA